MDDVLPYARNLGRDQRAVGPGDLTFHKTFPNDFARALVQGNDRGVGSAGRTDQILAVHERPIDKTPASSGAGKVPRIIFSPQLFAARCLQANQVALSRADVQPVRIDGGRAVAWPTEQP